MTLFVDKQKITGKETEQLFSAGISRNHPKLAY